MSIGIKFDVKFHWIKFWLFFNINAVSRQKYQHFLVRLNFFSTGTPTIFYISNQINCCICTTVGVFVHFLYWCWQPISFSLAYFWLWCLKIGIMGLTFHADKFSLQASCILSSPAFLLQKIPPHPPFSLCWPESGTGSESKKVKKIKKTKSSRTTQKFN